MNKLNQISSFVVLVYLVISIIATAQESFDIHENYIIYISIRTFAILIAVPCYFIFKKNALDVRFQILFALSLLVYNMCGYYFRPMYIPSFIHSIYALSFFIFMSRKCFIITSSAMTFIFITFIVLVRNQLPYSAGEQVISDLILVPLIAQVIAMMIHHFYTAQRQISDYANIQFGTVGRISARAIHDIKSSLGSPLLASELMNKAVEEKNYSELEAQSKKIADHFQVLKSYLISLNQISALSDKTDQSFLVSDCISEAQIILNPQLSKSQLSVSGDLKVLGSQKLMTSVFINLISNSIEQTENNLSEGLNLSIEIKNQTISYTDYTKPVSNEVYQKIKSQIHFTSKNQGSGLGLYFIREAAEQLNAKFSVQLNNNYIVFILKF